jgi:probable HAF family extracellular repeat protein
MTTPSRVFPAAAVLAMATTAARADVTYDIGDLTELAQGIGVVQCEGRSVNELGQVVGFELLPEFVARGLFWDSDGTPAVLDSLEGDNSTMAMGIENDGAILGHSNEVTVEYIRDRIIIHEVQKAVVWRGGNVINLNDLVERGGEDVTLQFSRDMDGAGRIVGFAGLIEGPPYNANGFLFDDGTVTDLGSLQRPVAINEHNQIVGYLQFGQAKAYLWDGGELVNLHDHPRIGGVTSRAYDINDDEMIVGEAQFHISKPEEATVWLNRVPTRLVPEYNRPQGIATGVNNRGQIVGFFNDLDDTQSPWRAFIWQDGERTDLLDLIDPNLGWEILLPFAINDRGQIVGGAIRNGEIGHGFLMTPLSGGCTRQPPWICDGDVDGDGQVNPVDAGLVQAAFGSADEQDLCNYDTDCDGQINPVDAGIVQSLFGTCDPPRETCP